MFCFSKKLVRLCEIGKKDFITDKPKNTHDIVFIRHAESKFNQACEDYRIKNNIPYVWKELCSHQGFDQKILFNYDFVDTRLTAKGKQQCQLARRALQDQKFDCILVSPQTRALQTYQQIFKLRNIPTFAEPLLSGPVRSCCDLSRQTFLKLNQFPEVNFARMLHYEHLWYLDFLPHQQQQEALSRIQTKGLKTFRQRCEQLLRMLKEQKIHEDAILYRKRMQRAKYRIAEFKQKYQRIAIYITAFEYMECGTPVYTIDIQNCRPYYCNFNDLLSVKEQSVVNPQNDIADSY